LTHSKDPIKSGVPSYAVQEEFNRYSGYWWQPLEQVNAAQDSCTYRIVYEEIDDSGVDVTYITPSCTDDFGYDSYRYPKAGTANSKIHLRMLEITIFAENNKAPVITQKKMYRSFYELFSWYEYLVRGDWTPSGTHFWVQIFDRLQTRAVTLLLPLCYFVDPCLDSSESQESNPMVTFINEQVSTTWINSHNIMHFLKEADTKNISFITANEETGFLHLYLYKFSLSSCQFDSDGILKATLLSKVALTQGEWCVEDKDNVSIDQANHLVYFTAYKNPIESHLYACDYRSDQPTVNQKQLTTTGFSHTIAINQKCTLFITICSNLNTSYKTYLYEITNVAGLAVKQLAQIVNREETKALSSSIDGKHPMYNAMNTLLNLNLDSSLLSYATDETALVQSLFKPPQLFTFSVDSMSTKLYGMIYMPFNHKPGEQAPTLLYVYGGPKAQLVTNAYKSNKFSRLNMLALLGYCVVVCDSRGSDYRGLSFESHLNRRMGQVEISDQVAGLEYASGQFGCIDLKRVAIYGWSYGGYMALMGLSQRPDVFKVAIAGAPVTQWQLYDTAYTERYMGLPEENSEGYFKGSVLAWAKSFPDEENRLLIIHGMIDENVHFVHTRKLINALVKENKPYQLQIYPNERHGIRSPEASVHCDINFYSFLEQNL
jgi:dipeptidyl-peptidase 9